MTEELKVENVLNDIWVQIERPKKMQEICAETVRISKDLNMQRGLWSMR